MYQNLACQYFFFTLTAVDGLLKSSTERESANSPNIKHHCVLACNIFHDRYGNVSIIICDAIKSNQIGLMML